MTFVLRNSFLFHAQLPLLASTSGDILEVFLVKHSLVCNQLGKCAGKFAKFFLKIKLILRLISGRFSFSSKTFRPEEKMRAFLSSPTKQQCLSQGSVDVNQQSSSQRTLLRGKYAAAKLYQCQEFYRPKDALDLGVNCGDLVGVIQKKDPMGNTSRWFCDNGLKQGFLPAQILSYIGQDQHSYDDVAPDEESAKVVEQKEMDSTEANPVDIEPSETKSGETKKQQQPVRKAPPVPKQQAATTAASQQQESLQEQAQTKILHPSDQQSNHSYEEIAASEVASEVYNY